MGSPSSARRRPRAFPKGAPPRCGRKCFRGVLPVLWTILVILLVLWLLGLVSGYTLGGFIHILLVLAVIVLIIRLLQGRSVV